MKFDFQKDTPALKAGDRAAFNKLMEDYYGWSVVQARQVIRDSERAKDAAVTFWEQLPRLLRDQPPADGALLPWMEVCIRNTAIDQVRAKQPKVRYEAEPTDVRADQSDPTLQLSALQDMEAIAAQLRSAQHKDVFWRLIEGATPRDIAEECGLSLKRAQNLISEVRGIIQQQIGDDNA